MRWPWRSRSDGADPSRARCAWLLAVFLVVALGPVVATLTAQPASRLALTASIAEHHTVDTDGYPHGIDRATYNGHLRSDKAPGQPLLAVPVYLVGRAFGAQSEAHLRAVGNLGAWWVTAWTSFLPFVALVVLMFLIASRYANRVAALGAALSIAVGSMMLPLSVNLYGAALASLCAFGAWAVFDAAPATNARLVVVGALAAASVAMEYETGIVLAVLAILVLLRVRRGIGWFVLGAAAPGLLLGWYGWAAFGKPWRTAHEYYATAVIRRQIVGFEFGWRGIDATMFGPHSLLRTSPIVLVALVIAVIVARGPASDARRHAWVGLAIVVPYLVLCMVWKGTPALEEPGPRYMIPALPFLAVPLAVWWDRIWRPAVLVAVWGAMIAVSASICGMLLGIRQSAFPDLPRRVIDGAFLPTVWSMAFGRWGVVVHVATVVVAGVALVRTVRTEQGRDAVEAAAP